MSDMMATYYGKNLSDMTKEELIEVILEMGQMQEQDMAEHLETLRKVAAL